jgi:MOSC domain-containing protein YiiM
MRGVVEHIHTSPGGVPKFPVSYARVGDQGIEGDGHAHPQFHGGPRKALLLITSEGLEELIALGFPVFPGALGENLTTRGLDRRQMRLGQVYRAGSVSLRLTTMRVPCGALDRYGSDIRGAVYDARVKAGDTGSSRWGLGGFYAAVIEPGEIRPQDIIALAE